MAELSDDSPSARRWHRRRCVKRISYCWHGQETAATVEAIWWSGACHVPTRRGPS